MKKNKRLAIFASSLIFLSGIGCGAAITNSNLISDHFTKISADDSLYNNLKYTVNSDDTITITGYLNKDLKELIVPDEIDGKTVTAIGDHAFADCPELDRICLGKNVTTIGEQIFKNSKNITELVLSDNITKIGKWGFAGLNISKLTVNDSVVSIPSEITSSKTLSEINVDENNKYFSSDKGVLYNVNKKNLIKFPCKSINDSYTVSDSTGTIESYAFADCKDLKTLDLGKNVAALQDEVFDDSNSNADINTNVDELILPDNIMIDGTGAFSNLKIKKLTLRESVESIPDSITSNSDLTEINVDEKNKFYSSDKGVLYNADKSILIKFPRKSINDSYTVLDSTKIIGEYAFQNCKNLKVLDLGKNVTKLAMSSLQNTDETHWGIDGYIEEIIIPDNLTDIHVSALQYMGFSKITVRDSVVSIPSSFSFNSKLSEINVDKNNKNFSSDKGVLYNKDKSVLIKFPRNSINDSYTVPDSTKAIQGYAFSDSKDLKTIDLGPSVTEIGEKAFACTTIFGKGNIDNLIISDNITSVDKLAFDKTGINTLTVPASVSSISIYFSDHYLLKNITVEEGNKLFSSHMGVLYNQDKSVLIKCPSASLLSKYTIDDNTKSISDNAFWGTQIQEISIPMNVKEIGKDVFRNGKLKTVKGYTGSLAETFASDNNYYFISLGAATTKGPAVTSTQPKETQTTTSASATKEPATTTTTSASTSKMETTTTTTTPIADNSKFNYDVNGDGKINIMDVMILKKYILNASN